MPSHLRAHMHCRPFLPAALLVLAAVLCPPAGRGENEIGFIERFALAADRERALQDLVPGSEDYYYYHAVHFQHERNAARLAEIMDQWRKRFPDESPRRRVIENREALLDYEAAPQKTLEFLKDRLSVELNHERDTGDEKPRLPTALDAGRIARAVYEKDALQHDAELHSLTPGAAAALVTRKVPLTMPQRRAVLGLIDRPDVPGLVEFILEELRDEESGGFGSFPVHEALLPAQLDALAKAMPGLAIHEEFVEARLRKLAPSNDVDLTRDPAAREAWLERLWEYVKTLPPAFNTLRAQALYLRLDHEWKKGVVDPARVLEYLKIPRGMPYVHERWLETQERFPAADLEEDLSGLLAGRGPVGSDEALIRACLLALFERAAAVNARAAGEALMKPYLPYVKDTWLRPILAEALITGGHGAPERWASLLAPAEFQRLKERVDIEFPKTNQELFKPGEAIAFDVILKNTPALIIRIYELNALNIFREQGRQLNTDLPLDGLVPNSEQTHRFDAGPFKRLRQTFQFPELTGRRGAWMIEIIGGGRSSRALIRVGHWQLVQQTGPGGDMLRVLDENAAPVEDAVAWLDGRKYTRDPKLGAIVIPFTSDPETRPVIIGTPDGSFATLAEFHHHAEHYRLDAQFHLEREQLLAGRTATLAIRAALRLGEAQLDLGILRNARLTVTATTHEGIATTQEFEGLKFQAGAVLTQTIAIPDRVASIEAELTGEVEKLSLGGEEKELRAWGDWTINEIDTTRHTSDGHLAKFAGDYVYELLGKNGEPRPEQAIAFKFWHQGFSRPQELSLKTDAKGRVSLGALAGIEKLAATAPNGREGAWTLKDFARTWNDSVHAGAGAPIRIPAPPSLAAAGNALPAAISLLQINGDAIVADLASTVKLEPGFLVIPAPAPGDYSLLFRAEEREVEIKVSGGKLAAGWYLGTARNLEAKGTAPLQITGIATGADAITVKLANVTPFTRVHVAATRFHPGRGIFGSLSEFTRFDPASGTPSRWPNLYSADRAIGDEYRYILERRHAQIFPGNLLPRPGLLLNPWEIRATDLEGIQLQRGEAAKQTEGGEDGEMEAPMAKMVVEADDEEFGESRLATNLDFLATAAPVLFNLAPDENGVVQIDRRALGDRQHVQIYAEDLANAVWQTLALPEAETRKVDLRLAKALDPATPLAQKKEVTVLATGQTLTLADRATSELETYDTLARIYALFRTLNPDPKLAEFAWVLEWPKLNDPAKRAKYSEYACHELNVFLWRKDAPFFEQVIRPYLANKKDKTFIDEFLLGADLAPYLEPAAYERLNMAERALLTARLEDAAANGARELRERWELLSPNPELQDRLFQTALRGRDLDEAKPGIPQTFGFAAGDKRMPAGEYQRNPEPAPKPGIVALQSVPARKGQSAAGGEKVPAKGIANFGGLPGTMRGRNGTAEGLAADKGFLAAAAPSPEALENLRQQIVKEEKERGALGEARITAGNRSGNLAISIPGVDALLFDSDATMAAREAYRPLYRTAGPAKEWAENNYYKLRIAEQTAELIPINAFWRDYAAWVAAGSKGAFISPHVAEAHRNFPEIMLALAVLDLPFEAPEHERKVDGAQFIFNARGAAIAFHKQIAPAPAPDAAGPGLLVSQSFFREDDRYRMEGNEQIEKYVTKEFLTGVVYGGNVVVTNPTSAPLTAEVLLQIPQGALPVLGAKATDSRRARLEPYSTQTFLYHFYFPATPAEGAAFAHFPVNVATAAAAPQGGAIARAEPFTFHVVEKLTEIDKASWEYISQHGTADEVFAFLKAHNLANLDLSRIAWRCRDAAFFRRIVAFLQAHLRWDETIYRYALLHNDPAALREWIKHQDAFVNACGPFFASKLVVLDPVERRAYEHLEYAPLVNQRAHRLGSEWRIANPAIREQYQALLQILAHKPALDAADNLSVAYYLFLQDRVAEALPRFRAVDPALLPTKLQHDYLRCHASIYEGKPAEARGIAAGYAAHPVPRWRILFSDVIAHLDEAERKAPHVQRGDQPDREKEQSALAATDATFDFKVENQALALTWTNLAEVTVNYYLMDPEFAFSSSPFVQQDAGRFSIIQPSHTAKHALPKDRAELAIPIPAEFARANVLIEVLGAGLRKTQAHHANTLRLMLAENFGRLEARDAANDRPIPQAYVKVYARLKNGAVRFYKDGYTDLRGRFDYASLNSPKEPPQPRPVSAALGPKNGLDYQMLKPAELDDVEKLAILVLTEKNGATTREVKPPKN